MRKMFSSESTLILIILGWGGGGTPGRGWQIEPCAVKISEKMPVFSTVYHFFNKSNIPVLYLLRHNDKYVKFQFEIKKYQ